MAATVFALQGQDHDRAVAAQRQVDARAIGIEMPDGERFGVRPATVGQLPDQTEARRHSTFTWKLVDHYEFVGLGRLSADAIGKGIIEWAARMGDEIEKIEPAFGDPHVLIKIGDHRIGNISAGNTLVGLLKLGSVAIGVGL